MKENHQSLVTSSSINCAFTSTTDQDQEQRISILSKSKMKYNPTSYSLKFHGKEEIQPKQSWVTPWISSLKSGLSSLKLELSRTN